MNRLKEYRQRSGLSQQQFASRVGEITRHRISDFENGVLPSASIRDRIKAAFPDAPDLLATLDRLPRNIRRKLTRLEPWPRSPDYREVWRRMRRVHAALLKKLGPVEVPELFESTTRCDSTFEPLSIVQLLVVGGVAYVASPYGVGFSLHPIVDEYNCSAGARLMPCIFLRLGRILLLFFPQVSLRPQSVLFRVDFLLLVVVGGKRTWFVIEIDGPGHDGFKDELQKEQMRMHVIRIPGSAVTDLRFLEYLKEELKKKGVPFK